jgi:hypothetical protein
MPGPNPKTSSELTVEKEKRFWRVLAASFRLRPSVLRRW